MNYGFYMAASGVMSGTYRLDVASNNLANVETAGFKPDVVMVRSRDAARLEDGLFHLPGDRMLERLGGGVLPWPVKTKFSQGGIEQTGRELDAALRGEDGFFVVRDGSAQDSSSIRLTRDGRFAVDSRGRLVTSSDGLPVLDTNDREIRVDPAAGVRINARGEVVEGERVVARLQVATVPDKGALEKIGAGLFGASESVMSARTAVADPLLEPGAVERSGSDPISAIKAVRGASGMITRNARMLDLHNDAMQLVISRLGRVEG